MADDSRLPGPSGKKSEKPTEPDEKLDIYSEKFDPLAFLLSDKAKVPRPNAKVFDNIAMWRTHYKGGSDDAAKRGRKVQKPEVPARRWLPHQLPVKSTRPQRVQKNVFTRMETVQGPLALLRKYVEEKVRIKIVTRNEKGVRGYCNAYLLAFDKHWNLALSDIDEVWVRSIKVKKNAIFCGDATEAAESNNRVRIPKIEASKVSKNTEECRRHVDQMVMRGEHVVLICNINGTSVG